MPNKQKVAMEEKVEYVRAYLRGEITQGRISKAAGVSLASVQVWIKRYKAEGVDGFYTGNGNKVYAPETKTMAVLDYLSGKGSHLMLIEDEFLSRDVAFVSMSENFDTSTPLGRAMVGILSVFAQLEREQIKERMCMGRAERAKNGYWHGGGAPPFGYKYYDNELHVDPIEAEIVKEIYTLFLQKVPIYSIGFSLSKKIWA